jgi:hypothetical protein
MDLQLAALSLVDCIVGLMSILLVIAVLSLYTKLRKTTELLDDLTVRVSTELSNMAEQVNDANNQQTEIQARSVVISKHLQRIDEKYQEMENQLRELKFQDPSLKLYQRAADLVKQGATIEEIIETCDIPRAEAEMLVMVHKSSS